MNLIFENHKLIKALSRDINLNTSNIEIREHISNQPYTEEILIVQTFLETQNIDTLLLKLGKHEFFRCRDFNLPFISFMSFEGKQYLAVVKAVGEDSVSYYTTKGEITENIDSFFFKWTGLSLLFFPDTKSIHYKKHTWQVYLSNNIKYLIKFNYKNLTFIT